MRLIPNSIYGFCAQPGEHGVEQTNLPHFVDVSDTDPASRANKMIVDFVYENPPTPRPSSLLQTPRPTQQPLHDQPREQLPRQLYRCTNTFPHQRGCIAGPVKEDIDNDSNF